MSEQTAVRVGLLIPSSNTMMEVDFVRGLPPHATLHTARMFMEDTTAAGEGRMLDEFSMGAARDIATARPDVVVFGCTSAGALRGDDYDAELCTRISAVTSAPTLSTIQAVRSALKASGAKRIGVITPYVDELNVKIRASIEADGIEVVGIAGLDMTENFEIARVTRRQIVDFATAALGELQIDLCFASCTNFGAVQARTAISEALGVPVVTSNQAVLEATIEHLGSRVGA